MKWLHCWIAALMAVLAVLPARAQEKTFRLKAAPELIESGVLKYMLPRFSLKTGVRIGVEELPLPADALEGADVFLLQSAALPATPDAVHRVDVFAEAGGRSYTLVVLDTDRREHAERFLDWITSPVGEAAITGFEVDGAPLYAAVEVEAVEVAAAAPTGDAALGEKIAIRRCGRCHVISDKNRFGGIGSTPSFGALKTLPRWQERFEAFWTLNPHPSFTQIEGVTEPFHPERPPPIAPVEMTVEEVEALLAFVHTIKPKDLGAPLILK